MLAADTARHSNNATLAPGGIPAVGGDRPRRQDADRDARIEP
jgi:hypothetical protein